MQLRLIMPAFDGLDVTYVSLDPSSADDVPGEPYYTVRDISRRNRLVVPVIVSQWLRILVRVRPHVVITTGSMPCLIGMAMAKVLFRSRTLWIDSIANAERMSSSGLHARRFADVWLTQWADLAGPDGPEYWGAVL